MHRIGKKYLNFPLAIHKSTLATPRSPGSPEGRRARERPPCPFGALNGRPERILPWHLGPTRAPRGGRRHAASIWAWRGTPAEHGAAGRRRPPEHRCSCWRSRRGCRDAARPAAGAPPCRDADACCTTEKSRHILSNPARPKARREARGWLAVGAPAAFVWRRLLKLLTPLFAKRLLKLLTFGRVTGGGNVTDGGLTAACTLRRMPASPREVGGAVGGNHRSPFHAWGV
jgi:hypothetical protein